MSEQHPNQTATKAARLFAPDALRGLIIAFMALDHANLFVAHKHPVAEIWDGTFPVYYGSLAFLTRWVTHLAPAGFFLLMGVGMALLARSRRARGDRWWAVSGHFGIRGLVLVAVQLLIVNRAWELSPGGWGVKTYIGVLCALGGTMILSSLLVWLKPAYLLLIAAALMIGIEFLHPGLGMWNEVSHDPLNVILFRPGGDADLFCFYPVLTWLELVVLGQAVGHWLADDPRKAFRRVWKMGVAFLLAFVVVRLPDGFGNIRPRMSDSWIDLLNPVKYPPSMAYTLMTTGVNLLLLWALSQAKTWAQRVLQPLALFGRTPLFFYVLHLFLYAVLGRLLAPNGTSIPAMYPVWLLGLLILFPLCLLYGRLKRWRPAHFVLRFL
jgi:uncharacterized membrane protein